MWNCYDDPRKLEFYVNLAVALDVVPMPGTLADRPDDAYCPFRQRLDPLAAGGAWSIDVRVVPRCRIPVRGGTSPALSPIPAACCP